MAPAEEVASRARRAGIAWTFVSPLSALLPRFRGDAVAGNEEAAGIVPRTEGLRQYVVIDPRRPETYFQAERLLGERHCVGIKIHPEEHGYPIGRFAQPIFEFAARHGAVVLTHSSEQNSLAADFVPWADRFPEVRLILAHIGWGWDGDMTHQVRAVQQSRHGNLYADTSSSRSIVSNVIEWAVREIGAERVLFGTDTPLYHAATQRARIEHADLADAEKRLILRENAIRLFGDPDVSIP
jgi:predicted TIM-barrel fold metal-dependent hydrolase